MYMFLSLLQEKKKEKKNISSERKAQRYFPFRSSLPLLSSLLAEPSDLFPPLLTHARIAQFRRRRHRHLSLSLSCALARTLHQPTNQPTHPHPRLLEEEEEVAAAAEEEEFRRRHAAATRRKRRGEVEVVEIGWEVVAALEVVVVVSSGSHAFRQAR